MPTVSVFRSVARPVRSSRRSTPPNYNTQWVNPESGGASDWGDLGGTITDQTDLIAYLAATYLALGGGALTGRVDFKPGNSTSASFRIPGGTAPSSPAHGDVYASGEHKFRHLC